MNVSEVRSSLLQGLTPVIVKYGFTYNKRKGSYIRKQNGFDQIFDLLFVKDGKDVRIEPMVLIKSHEIEAIYHQVSRKDKLYNDGTLTIGNNLFKIINFIDNGIEVDMDIKQSYLIQEEKDVLVLINVISKRFEEYALQYFDNYSSIRKVDELLNKYPRDISIHNWLYPLRACIAIIAAKMNNNPKFEELIKIYEKDLEEALDQYKSEFSDLKLLLLDKYRDTGAICY